MRRFLRSLRRFLVKFWGPAFLLYYFAWTYLPGLIPAPPAWAMFVAQVMFCSAWSGLWLLALAAILPPIRGRNFGDIGLFYLYRGLVSLGRPRSRGVRAAPLVEHPAQALGG